MFSDSRLSSLSRLAFFLPVFKIYLMYYKKFIQSMYLFSLFYHYTNWTWYMLFSWNCQCYCNEKINFQSYYQGKTCVIVLIRSTRRWTVFVHFSWIRTHISCRYLYFMCKYNSYIYFFVINKLCVNLYWGLHFDTSSKS